MKEKYLPLGTVALLKNATKKIMIIGYCVTTQSEPDKMYDYLCCMFPEGVVNTEENCLFNHEQIEKIICYGFECDEQKKFNEAMKITVKRINNN